MGITSDYLLFLALLASKKGRAMEGVQVYTFNSLMLYWFSASVPDSGFSQYTFTFFLMIFMSSYSPIYPASERF
jgi:hypothetical protein